VKDVLDSLKLLKKHGIPTGRYTLCEKESDALAFAKKVGYPVVLKVVSEKIVHKTEAGGIAICETPAELKSAFNKIKKLGKVLAQEKAEGIEVIVGVKKDPVFGHAVMFGLGGVFVEVYNDVTFRIAPVTKSSAKKMIDEIKGGKLIKGFRGKRGDIDALVDTIVKVSNLAIKENVKELDVNPLFVKEKGVVAVDARVELC